jgi:hypothetical protein
MHISPMEITRQRSVYAGGNTTALSGLDLQPLSTSLIGLAAVDDVITDSDCPDTDSRVGADFDLAVHGDEADSEVGENRL